jgi:hypothetical protein
MKAYLGSGGISPLIFDLGTSFASREIAPGTHWIGGWVGHGAFLSAVVKKKIPGPRREWNLRTPILQPVD